MGRIEGGKKGEEKRNDGRSRERREGVKGDEKSAVSFDLLLYIISGGANFSNQV